MSLANHTGGAAPAGLHGLILRRGSDNISFEAAANASC